MFSELHNNRLPINAHHDLWIHVEILGDILKPDCEIEIETILHS